VGGRTPKPTVAVPVPVPCAEIKSPVWRKKIGFTACAKRDSLGAIAGRFSVNIATSLGWNDLNTSNLSATWGQSLVL